jgi:hypothetical protein
VPICLRNRPCAGTVLPHTIDKLIAPLCLLLRYRSCQYACDLPTRFRANLPTEYDPVAGIILPPERPCRWYRTTTYTDNNRADMHTIHQSTDSTNTPAITTRPNDRADVPVIYRPNDRACTPAIYRLTDRRALCSTTITTAAGTVLPPEQTTTMPLCL